MMRRMDASSNDFAARLAAVAAETEALLDNAARPATPAAGEIARPPRLLEAMRYAALGGGKRLRPFLLVECARAVRRGPRRRAARRLRARMRALLFAGARRSAGHGRRRPAPRPADGAQGVRRGDRDPRRRRRCSHSPSMLMARAEVHADARVCAIALVSELARAAGIGGMAGGQMLDLAAEGRFARAKAALAKATSSPCRR